MTATILVVEDDDQVRNLVTTILKKLGHRTIEATNAWQALAELQRPVDLVILDIRMPYDVTGNDLIQTLQSLGHEIPVIVFSGWTEDLDTDLPSFVKAVVSKPVRVDSFVDTINTTLALPSTN